MTETNAESKSEITAAQLTDHQKQAILIIGDKVNVRPRQFARLFWPDSRGWQRSTKAGPSGRTRGGGMNLAGGGYLGRLRRKGIVKHNIDLEVKPFNHGPIYTLTPLGRELYRQLKSEESKQKDTEADKENQNNNVETKTS